MGLYFTQVFNFVCPMLALASKILKKIIFYYLKSYFIYFTIPFYNSPNISILIFHITLKYYLIFYSFHSLFSFFLIISLFTSLSFPHHFSLFTHNQNQTPPSQSKPANNSTKTHPRIKPIEKINKIK